MPDGRIVHPALSRRTCLTSLIAVTALGACSRAEPVAAQNKGGADAPRPRNPVAMTVYRDPQCGCCEKWAELARQAGYRVSLIDRTDMAEIKQQQGVPLTLQSCHTALVGGYVVEGHVPFEAVQRLLTQRPTIKGIAVAGMPAGSPGMEMPGQASEPIEVMAFGPNGKIAPFLA